MTDDSTLAKLLADALAKADDLQRQLAAADARASHYERLAQQHETRLRDAADVWQALERTLQHTRSELGRVLPPDVAATSTPTTRAIALSRVATQVTLPPPVPAKAISFPSLPPPPLPNPRNSQLLQTAAPVAAPAPAPQTSVARPVATTNAAVLAQRKERARFSDSPPPFAGAAAAESRKRKRDDDLEEELVATVDGTSDDSVSEMSLDDMILAVSGEDPTHGQQAVPQPSATAVVSSAATSPAPQPPRKKHAQSSSVSSMPTTASSANPTCATTNGPAQPTGQALYPSHNAQGQRQCRACGQAGRYKDGKCVEKWGPGPAGPGTVCDRCRKKMKRVERRDLAPAAAAQVPRTTASPTISSPVPAVHAPASPVCTSATVTAAASPNVRPGTAETMRPASADSGLHQVAKHLEFKADHRPTTAPTPVHQLPNPAQSADHDREVLPAPRERGFYDAARERRVSTEHDERERERRQTSAERDERLDSPLTSGPLSHFGTSSRGSPAFSSSAMEHGHRLEQPPSLQPALSHFGHSSAAGFSSYRSQDIMPLPSRSSFAAITGLHRDSYANDRSSSSYVRSPMPRFAYEPPTSSLRSSGPWGGKHDEVEPVA